MPRKRVSRNKKVALPVLNPDSAGIDSGCNTGMRSACCAHPSEYSVRAPGISAIPEVLSQIGCEVMVCTDAEDALDEALLSGSITFL